MQMRVHPTLIPTRSLLGHVDGVFNAVWVEGDTVGDTLYYGRGAGREPTASAVTADIIDAALNLQFGSHLRVPAFRPHCGYADIVAMSAIRTRYYLRLQVLDQPKVLAEIAGILGSAGISIASVTQQEAERPAVPIVILTHEAREADMQDALAQIAQLAVVAETPVLYRIEDLG